MRLSYFILSCFMFFSCHPVNDDSEAQVREEAVDESLYQLKISADFSYQTQKKVSVTTNAKNNFVTQLKIYRECCTQENLLADIQFDAVNGTLETWVPAYLEEITLVFLGESGSVIEQHTRSL